MKTALQIFSINNQAIELFVPSGVEPKKSICSPYWAKVWPAALGLCQFLQNNLHFVQGKTVTELAAGLGLPSIFVAKYADTVFCTDIEAAAIKLIHQSILHNKLSNIKCAVADWQEIDTNALHDVVLLSDVNYEPKVFDGLLKVIQFYLEQGSTIILSTPQRLMAKPFIEQLLQYCVTQSEIMVIENGNETAISILVLRVTKQSS